MPQEGDSPARADALPCVDLLIERLSAMPVPPEALAGLLESVARGDETEELARRAACDPVLAGRLVSAAGERRPDLAPASLEQALEALGPEGVRSAALAIPPAGWTGPDDGVLDYPAFCQHCLAVARAAEAVARRSPHRIEPGLAFLAGLLHDIGKVLLAWCLPKSYRRVLSRAELQQRSLVAVEQETLGADHALAGRRVARQWRFPRAVEQVVWLHHQPPGALDPTGRIVPLLAAVQLADAIVREQRIGFSGNPVVARGSADLAADTGLTPQDAAAIAQEVSGATARALEAPGAPGEAAYNAAVASAAAGLSLAQEDLSRQVVACRRQARALEQLCAFVARVAPAATVAALCREMAALFAEACGLDAPGSPPTLALAFEPDRRATLALLRPGGQEAFRSVRCDAPPGPPRVCPAVVLTQQDPDPRAWDGLPDPEDYLALPLPAAGTWAGAVLLARTALPTEQPEQLAETLAGVAGFVLAAVAERSRADRTAEQLAQALQRLGQTSDALAEARALAALGEMAAGAAHEMNNPLTVISGRAQLLAERAQSPDQREAAELIARKAQDISDIATELMSYARPAAPVRQAVPVAALLEAARSAFLSGKQQKPAVASVDMEVDQTCPPVWVDRGQMESVFVELLANAAAAAREPVKVTMQASLPPGASGVLIRVTDNGPGMDQATLTSALTPFFSHRQAGRGRGMGLARAHRTVQVNGGRMWIQSRLGKGTTVFVELPRAPTAATG